MPCVSSRRLARLAAYRVLAAFVESWDGKNPGHPEDPAQWSPVMQDAVRIELRKIALHTLKGRPRRAGACCEYEARSINGGCINCDDPCL